MIEPLYAAFPHPDPKMGYWGMSLREYFMAHAPHEPAPWFKPVMENSRPVTIWTADEGGKVFATIKEAEQECGEAFHNANGEAQHQWDKLYEIERWVQWPAAWADMVLARRKVTP